MMYKQKKIIVLAVVIVLIGFAGAVAMAGEPKYCINYETGQVFAVGAGMPCPWPTVEY